MRKVIFLDRDGVINHDPGDYTKHISEFTILNNVALALLKFKKMGFDFIVITNQGGIAKGMYTLNDFYEIDNYMHDFFRKNNTPILDTFFCPHVDTVSNCLCRKPKSGMVEKAIAKYKVDSSKSFFIGDKMRDVECAERAGVKGIKIDVNGNLEDVEIQEKK
jgi:D-glycero-D-manno-heptose 1,7-bisphosphate phosphatase